MLSQPYQISPHEYEARKAVGQWDYQAFEDGKHLIDIARQSFVSGVDKDKLESLCGKYGVPPEVGGLLVQKTLESVFSLAYYGSDTMHYQMLSYEMMEFNIEMVAASMPAESRQEVQVYAMQLLRVKREDESDLERLMSSVAGDRRHQPLQVGLVLPLHPQQLHSVHLHFLPALRRHRSGNHLYVEFHHLVTKHLIVHRVRPVVCQAEDRFQCLLDEKPANLGRDAIFTAKRFQLILIDARDERLPSYVYEMLSVLERLVVPLAYSLPRLVLMGAYLVWLG